MNLAKTAELLNWEEANQHHLAAALSVVRRSLERYISPGDGGEKDAAARQELQEASSAMPAPPALDNLCAIFALSPFERDVLLLCAGVELDSIFTSLCARAQGDPSRAYPTFSLALAVLPDPHWSALTPAAPLRHWRLVEVGPSGALTLSPLRIDERVLHYLTGVQQSDERLAGIIEPLRHEGEIVPSHRAIVDRIVATWSQASRSTLPVVQLCGDEDFGKRAIASTAYEALGLQFYAIRAQAIPTSPSDLDALIRLLKREAALSAGALLLDCEDVDSNDIARESAIARLIDCLDGALIVFSRQRRRAGRRPIITYDVHRPTASEQRKIWHDTLGAMDSSLDGKVEMLVSQFNMSAPVIRAACAEGMASGAAHPEMDSGDLGELLWDASKSQTRPLLDDLAQRIVSKVTWDDLVLPEAELQILRDIIVHVRQRTKVYEGWGFAAKSPRGLGISALFVGPSGTGKTLAAEVLANDLGLDLYRTDLSQIVSKYIGETEKNLKRVFDAAEDCGAVLLFDEADALFGKRSEVRDSHDRYANIEVSYLLQRMEAYRGLAILTTNMKDALDASFLRRIRFIVQFPFPDAAQRREIWRRIFPPNAPTEGLDFDKLARLDVAGGNIRNIALHAAFSAAEAGEPVRMAHLKRAAYSEYTKIEKMLVESEVMGWN